MAALKLITAPTSYPVSLVELQEYCNAPESDFEVVLEICRKAASSAAEKFTGLAFYDQTWDLILDAFPSAEIKIPKPPLIEIVGVFYRDGGGTEQEIESANYVIDNGGDLDHARLFAPYAGTWPTVATFPHAVRVRFRAGYVDQDQSPEVGAVPYEVKAGVLLEAASLFANRETVVIGQSVALNPTAHNLLRLVRVETAIA